MMDDLISRAAAIAWFFRPYSNEESYSNFDVERVLKAVPAVDAVPVEWLNERHRKCCEEGDTDLMDAITVLCNEYHVWQKEQEAR